MMGFRQSSVPAPSVDALLADDVWTHSAHVADSPEIQGNAGTLDGFLLSDFGRPRCAGEGCVREPRFWKKSARPVYEGAWGCNRACMLELVQASIRRQVAFIGNEGPSAHRHRIPLGLVLLDQGAITQFQLRQALDAQRMAGRGRIGEWLDETCGVTPDKILRGLAVQWNRPVLSTLGFRAERMALVMPDVLRRELGVVPVRVAAGKLLYIAFGEQIDAAAVAMLERMTGLSVETGLVVASDFALAERGLAAQGLIPYGELAVADLQALGSAIVDLLFQHGPVASRLVAVRERWWLRLWLERDAVSRIGTLPESGEDVMDFVFSFDSAAR